MDHSNRTKKVMTQISERVGYSYLSDTDPYQIPTEQFNALRFLQQLPFTSVQEIRSEVSSVEFFETLRDKFSLTTFGSHISTVKPDGTITGGTFIFSNEELVIYASFSPAFYYIKTATATAALLDNVMTLVTNELPVLPLKDPGVIPITFWTSTPNGPRARVRKIRVPRWSHVEDNYPSAARQQISDLMAMRTPDGAGRLILWHGPPGTGKSHAIRAMIKEWSPWCSTNYIVDPEAFFGHAEYMMSVLLEQNHADPRYSEDEKADALVGDDRWMLLIIEDSGEFIKHDAKADQGQSLARLLNLADGLLGQGINLLILITTNEKLGELHPAVTRNGRCLSNIEFPEFTPVEATAWLNAHDLVNGNKFKTDVTLAQLYEEQREIKQVKLARPAPTSTNYL